MEQTEAEEGHSSQIHQKWICTKWKRSEKTGRRGQKSFCVKKKQIMSSSTEIETTHDGHIQQGNTDRKHKKTLELKTPE